MARLKSLVLYPIELSRRRMKNKRPSGPEKIRTHSVRIYVIHILESRNKMLIDQELIHRDFRQLIGFGHKLK